MRNTPRFYICFYLKRWGASDDFIMWLYDAFSRFEYWRFRRKWARMIIVDQNGDEHKLDPLPEYKSLVPLP